MTWATDRLRTHSLPAAPESSAKAATRRSSSTHFTIYTSPLRAGSWVSPSHLTLLSAELPSQPHIQPHPRARTSVKMMSVMPSPAVHIPMHLDAQRSIKDVEFNEVRPRPLASVRSHADRHRRCPPSWATWTRQWNPLLSECTRRISLSDRASLTIASCRLIRKSARSVRLYCTIPTGCPSSASCASPTWSHDLPPLTSVPQVPTSTTSTTCARARCCSCTTSSSRSERPGLVRY